MSHLLGLSANAALFPLFVSFCMLDLFWSSTVLVVRGVGVGSSQSGASIWMTSSDEQVTWDDVLGGTGHVG